MTTAYRNAVARYAISQLMAQQTTPPPTPKQAVIDNDLARLEQIIRQSTGNKI